MICLHRKSYTTLGTYGDWYIYPETPKLNCTEMSACAYSTLLFNDFTATCYLLYL